MGSKISCLMWMTPYKMPNLVSVDFSKFFQIWAKIFKKIWKNRVILPKIWPKIGPIGIWMGHFKKKWYFYGSSLKFRSGMSLPKPNLSTSHDVKHIRFVVILQIIACLLLPYIMDAVDARRIRSPFLQTVYEHHTNPIWDRSKLREVFPVDKVRPKKKMMFVRPFPTNPKYCKIRISFFFFFIFEQKC